MLKRPNDMLEFLRRKSDDPAVSVAEEPLPAARPPEPSPPPSSEFLRFRRSQVIVAGVGAGLAVILAFLLGMVLSGGGKSAASGAAAHTTQVWVLRLITYDDTPDGLDRANRTVDQLRGLEKQGYDLDEVSLQRIASQKKLVVAIGCWLRDPRNDRKALALRQRVRELSDPTGARPFSEASFWTVQR